MSDTPEPTGNEQELPRRGFMAKAGALADLRAKLIENGSGSLR